jgi:hypothetical protein
VPFVELHYTDASGAPAALRASAEHLVLLAASELPPAAAAAAVPPGGRARRADMVAVGDLLVVRAGWGVEESEAGDASKAGAGGDFYTAAVERITT